MSLYEYAGLVSIVPLPQAAASGIQDQTSPTRSRDTPPAPLARGRPANGLFRFHSSHPLYATHVQQLRSRFLVPVNVDRPPVPPASDGQGWLVLLSRVRASANLRILPHQSNNFTYNHLRPLQPPPTLLTWLHNLQSSSQLLRTVPGQHSDSATQRTQPETGKSSPSTQDFPSSLSITVRVQQENIQTAASARPATSSPRRKNTKRKAQVHPPPPQHSAGKSSH